MEWQRVKSRRGPVCKTDEDPSTLIKEVTDAHAGCKWVTADAIPLTTRIRDTESVGKAVLRMRMVALWKTETGNNIQEWAAKSLKNWTLDETTGLMTVQISYGTLPSHKGHENLIAYRACVIGTTNGRLVWLESIAMESRHAL